MHPSILREFHLSIAAEPGPLVPAGRIVVRLQHTGTAEAVVFRVGSDGMSAPARVIEEHVLRTFPTSAAAGELRTLYGRTRHTLKPDWNRALGERLFFTLANTCRSKGARFWAELIPTLPNLLYSAMTARAVDYLGRLDGEVELHAVIKAVYDAWLAVLKEVRHIPIHPKGLERLALDLHGWPTELIRTMSVVDYSRLKEKALFAKLSLDYLSEEDWAEVVSSLLETAPAPSALVAAAAP